MATLATPSVDTPETEKSHAGLNEPSMEDILASIRRIIAEDQSNSLGRSGLGGLTRRASAAAAVVPAMEPPLALADEAAGAVAPAPLAKAAPADDQPVDDRQAPEQPQAVLDEVHQADQPVRPEQPVQPAAAFSPGATLAVPVTPVASEARPSPGEAAAAPTRDAFVAAELAAPARDHWVEDASLISRSAGESITSSFHALAETVLLQDPDMVERVTRDVLRPMLKTWLDDNLPSIVERLVRVEIERVARGGRSRD